MMRMHIPGLVCAALALVAVPAAAQTPDGMTPAEETLCDSLADATPGLYGLCVAMCEAQDCKATLDPDTGEVTFDESCNASAPRILANYNKKAEPTDPRMPCVEIACACWSEVAIDNVGGRWNGNATTDTCIVRDTFAGLFGNSTEDGRTELAYALGNGTGGGSCIRIDSSTSSARQATLRADEYTTCRQSVIDECAARGLYP